MKKIHHASNCLDRIFLNKKKNVYDYFFLTSLCNFYTHEINVPSIALCVSACPVHTCCFGLWLTVTTEVGQFRFRMTSNWTRWSDSPHSQHVHVSRRVHGSRPQPDLVTADAIKTTHIQPYNILLSQLNSTKHKWKSYLKHIHILCLCSMLVCFPLCFDVYVSVWECVCERVWVRERKTHLCLFSTSEKCTELHLGSLQNVDTTGLKSHPGLNTDRSNLTPLTQKTLTESREAHKMRIIY